MGREVLNLQNANRGAVAHHRHLCRVAESVEATGVEIGGDARQVSDVGDVRRSGGGGATLRSHRGHGPQRAGRARYRAGAPVSSTSSVLWHA